MARSSRAVLKRQNATVGIPTEEVLPPPSLSTHPNSLWATSFYPYSDILKLDESKRYFGYAVSRNNQFVGYHREYPKVDMGQKLHVLLRIDTDEQKKALERFWERLFPLLALHQVVSFKIRRPDVKISSHKEFTLYTFANPEKKAADWDYLMREIEKIAIEEGCEPGVLPPANKMITGSKFISYRNDKHVDGTYITDKAAAEYAARHPGLDANNLTCAKDIFADIDISKPLYTFSALK